MVNSLVGKFCALHHLLIWAPRVSTYSKTFWVQVWDGDKTVTSDNLGIRMGRYSPCFLQANLHLNTCGIFEVLSKVITRNHFRAVCWNYLLCGFFMGWQAPSYTRTVPWVDCIGRTLIMHLWEAIKDNLYLITTCSNVFLGAYFSFPKMAAEWPTPLCLWLTST